MKTSYFKILYISLLALFVLFSYTDNVKYLLSQSLYNSQNLLNQSIDFNTYTANIEQTINECMAYHDILMDLNSIILNVFNDDYVIKNDTTIVKMSNGYLNTSSTCIDEDKISEGVDEIYKFYNYVQKHNSNFLYIMCPSKGYTASNPLPINNYVQLNSDCFANKLFEKQIPSLIIQDEMLSEGITEEEAFFVTDHHWTPNTAFWATSKICTKLKNDYNFDYISEYFDYSNYNIITYQKWFLGSQGKKVGQYFTDLGTDDIDLIIPKFETSFEEFQPSKNEFKFGSFEDTLLNREHIDTKDYYSKNPYAAYTGGDFRLQIINNTMRKDGKTFLILRDSFACAVTPFLALQAKQLVILDIRDYLNFVGPKYNVYDAFNKYHPDYVLIIYTGPASGKGDKLDFGTMP